MEFEKSSSAARSSGSPRRSRRRGRLGQTAVLGELLAGVVIGPGVLGLVHESEILHALTELGVLILLFKVGLASDLGELLKAGVQSGVVALVGVALPLLLGFVAMQTLGHPVLLAVFVGATLTATSVGVTARVLADLGRLHHPAAKVVLGAAVVDDVLGLLILAVVTGMAHTGEVAFGQIAVVSGKAIAFLVIAIALGVRFAPTLVRWIGGMQARGMLLVAAVVFAVTLAAIADAVGLATIIGAFAAGLVLARSERGEHVEQRIRPVADLLVPIFFVSIGMKVEPSALNPLRFWTGEVHHPSQFVVEALNTNARMHDVKPCHWRARLGQGVGGHASLRRGLPLPMRPRSWRRHRATARRRPRAAGGLAPQWG